MGIPGMLSTALGAALLTGASFMDMGLARAADTMAADTPRYQLTNLGRVPRGRLMQAMDINDLGEVVGEAGRFGSLSNVGFVYRNGALQMLSSPLGDVAAKAINDRGDVAGWAAGPDQLPRPVIFRNGTAVEIKHASGRFEIGQALAINNAGMATGEAALPSVSLQKTFVYDGTSARLLDIEAEAFAHRGFSINEAGDVLIRNSLSPSVYYVHSGGRTTRLPELRPDPSGLNETHYVAINNAGQILGNQVRFGLDGSAQFFLYRNGTADLVAAPDGRFVTASDFNDQGWVVGQWGEHKGFLYRDGRMHAFEDLLRSDMASRWSNVVLTGINEAGQIVGHGLFIGPSGRTVYRSFVATPVPEPSTMALMLAGVCAVGWTIRARQQRSR